jgi:hypothetical protein
MLLSGHVLSLLSERRKLSERLLYRLPNAVLWSVLLQLRPMLLPGHVLSLVSEWRDLSGWLLQRLPDTAM